MVMNRGVEIRCKVVMAQLFTTVDLLVELCTSITKSKSSIESHYSIR